MVVDRWTRRYWERRWRNGRGAGNGSRPVEMLQKASYLNTQIEYHHIRSILDLGCGDCRIYPLLNPVDYFGMDISPAAMCGCPPGTTTAMVGRYRPPEADMTMSLDVIYHLVDDEAYRAHLDTLCSRARKLVVIYSTDRNGIRWPWARHIRHRKFTDDVEEWHPGWRLVKGDDGGRRGARFFKYVPRGGETMSERGDGQRIEAAIRAVRLAASRYREEAESDPPHGEGLDYVESLLDTADDLDHAAECLGALEGSLREAEPVLEFAVSIIEHKAPEMDWPESSPRKALKAVKDALYSIDRQEVDDG